MASHPDQVNPLLIGLLDPDLDSYDTIFIKDSEEISEKSSIFL